MVSEKNPIGLKGIEFIEFAAKDSKGLETLFGAMGFNPTHLHSRQKIDLFTQNQIVFVVNREPGNFASRFVSAHGPCACAMGWRVENALVAQKNAVARGAKVAVGDHQGADGKPIPAIYGIGDSLIYFVEGEPGECYAGMGFKSVPVAKPVAEKGFLFIDHLTNNVPNGTMDDWSSFYKNTFGFTEVRHFDIRGKKTGLVSYALRSPDGSFCIPINEAKEEKSQINEYLREYKGAGIQHIALATKDIVTSLRALRAAKVNMLDVEPSYYDTVFDRVPNVTEDRLALQELGILVDGDEEGYLLQIFTQNVIGPIFFEIIQRKNHLSFGEGNFGALFRSIEKDQEKRGVL